MSLLSFTRQTAVCFCWGLVLALPAAVFGQTNYYATNGTEYAIIGSLPGDQVWPDVAVTPAAVLSCGRIISRTAAAGA